MRILLLSMLLGVFMPLGAQDAKALLTLDELTGDWKISKEFTLAVAEKMPAEDYNFKASPEEMTFGQQMLHIAMASTYRFWQLTGATTPFKFDEWKKTWEAAAAGKADKAATMQYLSQSFDYVIGLLPKITPEQMAKTLKVDWVGRPEVNGRQMMMNMFMHVAHHRAQCEVYLRIKGIKPPEYRF